MLGEEDWSTEPDTGEPLDSSPVLSSAGISMFFQSSPSSTMIAITVPIWIVLPNSGF